MNDEKYIRDRITELRLKKGVSEYQMSLDLGHGKSYIQGISSGRVMPSMKEFLSICEYFGISAAQFFEEKNTNPILVQKAVSGMQGMSDKDLLLVISLIDRLKG
ncbi:MAG: helix-turn-helix transcriptional regulator [Oscillospiraceae bacterium]